MDAGAGAVSRDFRRGPVDMESGPKQNADSRCGPVSVRGNLFMARHTELPGDAAALWNIGPGMELCLRLDGIGALFSGLASLIWVLVVFFAFEYMEHEREEARFSDALLCPWEP